LNPKEAIGRSTNFSNNFTSGSFGLLKNNLSFNHFDGKLRIGLQYGHMETDGYRQNSNFERDGFLLNTSYQLNPKNKISLLVNHIDFTAQIPSSLGATAFAEDPQQATFTWRESQGFEANNYTLVGLNYAHRFNDNLENSTSVFYTYLDKVEARPFGILDEITKGFGFRTRFSGGFDFLENNATYSFGGELYKDEYDWDEFENLWEENNGNGSLKGSNSRAIKNSEPSGMPLEPYYCHSPKSFRHNSDSTSTKRNTTTGTFSTRERQIKAPIETSKSLSCLV